MKCAILTSQASIAEIAAEWDALQQRAGRSIFTAYGWVDAWWRHLGRAHDWQFHIVTGRIEGRLVAVAPMAILRRKGLRLLYWAGADTSDYSDFLLEDAGHAGALWNAVRKSPHFDIARIQEIPPDALCREQLEHFGRLQRIRSARQIRIDWPNSQAWLASLSSSTRQFHRKRTRKLEAEGKLRFDVYGSEPLDEDAFAAMVRYKKQWAERYGIGGVLCCDGVGPFFRDIARLESDHKRLHFSVLRCAGEVVAVHMGFVVDGAFYCYLPSYNPKWHRFSPGKILMLHCIAWAVDNGCREFDFLRGEESFKNTLANASRPLHDYTFAITLKGRLAQFLFKLVKRKAPVKEGEPQVESAPAEAAAATMRNTAA